MRRLAIAMLIAAAVGLAAEEAGPPRAGAPRIPTTGVSMTSSQQFVPMDVTIAVNDAIEWTNNDSAVHTSTSDTGIWDSGNIAAGASYSRQFTSTGSFPYHSTLDGGPGTGMHGTVTVVGTPVISSPSTAHGTVGSPFRFAIIASESATSFTISGLPAGLSQDPTFTDIIGGTPTASGTFPVSITATNDASLSGNQTLTVTIDPAVGGAPVISSATAAAAAAGSAFSYVITAAPAATMFSASDLPIGLALDVGSGAITGSVATPSVSDVTIGASNGSGADTTQIVVVIAPGAATTSTTGAGATTGTATGTGSGGYGTHGGGGRLCGMGGGATALSLALTVGWIRRRSRSC
jgi:plastocyanin